MRGAVSPSRDDHGASERSSDSVSRMSHSAASMSAVLAPRRKNRRPFISAADWKARVSGGDHLLACRHRGIAPACVDELGVGTRLDDVSILEDENEVGVADGGQAVRDDDPGDAEAL